MRLVRIPHRLHEQGQCPLGHSSLDAQADGEPCLLKQLADPEAEPTSSETVNGLARKRLEIRAMSVSHHEVRLTA
jgi:hypothetical protein